MRRLRAWWLRFAGLFNKQRKDRELDDEMESHLQLHIEDNLRLGITPEEARRQALIQLGGIESTKEAYRDQRGLPALEILWKDLVYGIRILRKNPGFSAVAVLTLALGVCAVTTQFSIFNGLLLRGLPFPEPDRLIGISLRDPTWIPTQGTAPSMADFFEWQREQRCCESLAASDSYRWLNVTIEGNPRPISGLFVTRNFFSVLGIKPMIGRDFSALDNQPGAERVVLISHEIWMRDFGGIPNIVGHVLRLEGRPTTVIGVMPPGFRFPEQEQIWAPLVPAFSEKSPRGQAVGVVARLKADESAQQATADFTGIARRLAREFPQTNRQFVSVKIEPLKTSLTGGMRDTLLALLLAAVTVLVIACVNVMNLQFVRVSTRMRELAMRGALGASPGRLLRQTLTEGVLLVIAGSVVGVAMTHWTTQLCRDALGGIRFGGMPGWAITNIDLTVLAFTLAVMAASVLGSSLIPSLFASRVNAMAVLKEGSHGQSNGLVNRIGNGLVVAQISLTCALLIASLLQLQSITKHANMSMGFKTDSVLVGRLSLEYGYRSEANRRLFFERFLRELRGNPEFTQVALTSRALAIGGGWTGRFQVEDSTPLANETDYLVPLEYISDGYFDALGLRALQGHEFEPGGRGRAELPALVNETFARAHFGGQSALGHRIRLRDENNEEPKWRTIVGVVPDTNLQAFDQDRDGSGVFFPMDEFVPTYPSVVVRGPARPEALSAELRRAVIQLDPDLTLYGLGTAHANLLAFNGQARVLAAVSAVFAIIACLLATVGLYGITSFAVSQRTKDFGIRMALGADRPQIMGLVVQRGLVQLIVGASTGVALTLMLIQVAGAQLHGFLYQVNPHDPFVYGAVILLLAISTILACLVPARRAAKVDPIVALRAE